MNVVEAIYKNNGNRKLIGSNMRRRGIISMSKILSERKAMGRKGFIFEFKRKSPSGFSGEIIRKPQEFMSEIGKSADAISVLTEPENFLGSLEDGIILQHLSKPMLMKDFVDRREMIDSGFRAGFDAFLLISDFLSEEKIFELAEYGMEKGMDVLVEFHSEDGYARIPDMDGIMIGYNRRNLRTLKMEPAEEIAIDLIKSRKCIKVLESGINVSNMRKLIEMPYDAYLIGTSVLNDPKFLKEIKEIEGNYHDE
ncbi:indole-3-glycerol-phosphate synthase TrpC [Cuniculiplasma sp. SKW3]|uniref:indole-3-glycerol-phosphate synthase TrpC n=1 Tax=Cuniculiplasma sp. SKW3 TaxID=3400170 RepID=UPI003FD51D7B